MKILQFIFLGLFLVSTSLIGQTVKQKRAERLYNNFSFVKAIDTYEKIVAKDDSPDDYTLRKLGDSYMMLRNPEKAKKIYEEVVKNPVVPSEYYLYYAQALRATGDYEASKSWMKKYKEVGNTDDLRVKSFFKNDDYASAIFNTDEKNILENLSFNTKFNEFGAVVLNDSIVFTSSRDIGVAVKRLYAWDKQPMLDIYKTSIINGSVSSTTELKGDVNSIHHDGPAIFSSDGTKMYFSRNNYHESKKINDKKGIMHIGIYSADYQNGVWQNIKPINLNSPDYIVYHPTIDEANNKMYFSSDMPGGFGGTDIYVSDILEDGSFSTPKNLGAVVNTEGNESFPFIHTGEDVLYFSSDGHVGLGLLDVFATVKNELNEYVNVINLGSPINSKKDDFAYYLSEEGLKGYISSNRKGGQGGDDIYAFTKIPPLILKGKVFDAINNDPIEGAEVVLERENGEQLTKFYTEADGSFEHLIQRDKNFVLKGTKEKYIAIEKAFNSFGLEKERELIVDLNIAMKPIEDVVILADLETIYFDLDKYNIREDAAFELDKVVKLLHKYSGMIIRLESHTDSRAPDEYNMNLSQNRAKSTYDYIISAGINPERITEYKGFGESQLVNKCKNGVRCTEEEHQLNRRTEFIIIKMK